MKTFFLSLLLLPALSPRLWSQDVFTIDRAAVSAVASTSTATSEYTVSGYSGFTGPGVSPGGPPGEFQIDLNPWSTAPGSEFDAGLRMQLTGGTIQLMWNPQATPVILESSQDLTLWEAVNPQPSGQFYAAPAGSRRYYRLTRQ